MSDPEAGVGSQGSGPTNLRPEVGRGMHKACFFVCVPWGTGCASWLPGLSDCCMAPLPRWAWDPRVVSCTCSQFAGGYASSRTTFPHSLGLVGQDLFLTWTGQCSTRLGVLVPAGGNRDKKWPGPLHPGWGVEVRRLPGEGSEHAPRAGCPIEFAYLPSCLFPVLFNYRQRQRLCQ